MPRRFTLALSLAALMASHLQSRYGTAQPDTASHSPRSTLPTVQRIEKRGWDAWGPHPLEAARLRGVWNPRAIALLMQAGIVIFQTAAVA